MKAKCHFLIVSFMMGFTAINQGVPVPDSVHHAAGLISQGSLIQAKTELEHILQRHPENKDARLLMGLDLAKMSADAAEHGEIASAIEQLRKSLGFNPADAYAHRDLAKALYAQGGKEEAVRECEKAARLSPDDSGLAGGCGLGVDSDKSIPEFLGLPSGVPAGRPKGTSQGDWVPPKPINNPPPEASGAARQLHFGATAHLWITVSSQGVVTEAAIVREAGLGFDQSSLRAVRQWTFQPATLNGEPVSARVQVEASYRFF